MAFGPFGPLGNLPPGLFADPRVLRAAAPQAPPADPSALDKLFGSDKMSRIAAGLSMINASQDPGYGNTRPNLGGIALQGMQAGQQTQAGIDEKQRRAALRDTIGGGDPAKIRQAIYDSIAAGDTETAATLQAMLPKEKGPYTLSEGQALVSAEGTEIAAREKPQEVPDWKGTGEMAEEGGEIFVRTNPETGEPEYRIGPPTKEDSGDFATQMNTLRDDHRSLLKDHGAIEQVRFTQNAAQGYALQNAAGDRLLIQSIAKLNDPGSIVRNSEFETWSALSGVSDRVLKAAKKLDEGILLTAEERKVLYDIANQMAREARTQLTRDIENLRLQGTMIGVPGELLLNPWDTVELPGTGGAGDPQTANDRFGELTGGKGR